MQDKGQRLGTRTRDKDKGQVQEHESGGGMWRYSVSGIW